MTWTTARARAEAASCLHETGDGGFMSRLSDGRPKNSERVAWMSPTISSGRPGFTMSAMAYQSQPQVSIQLTVDTVTVLVSAHDT
jgi:hypothetical protein